MLTRTHNSITVTWARPEGGTLEERVTGYIVHAQQCDGASVVTDVRRPIITRTVSEAQFAFPGLRSGDYFRFRVSSR
ncbi:MAG: fibronectin type III domain-containing protein, partial [Hydrogenophaga sp.]